MHSRCSKRAERQNSISQNENPGDIGIYQSLKKFLQEKDENGDFWFTKDILWGIVIDIFGGGSLIFIILPSHFLNYLNILILKQSHIY